jgi:hypothetical protein
MPSASPMMNKHPFIEALAARVWAVTVVGVGPGGGGGWPGGGGRGGGMERLDGKKVLKQIAKETGGGYFEVSKRNQSTTIMPRLKKIFAASTALATSPITRPVKEIFAESILPSTERVSSSKLATVITQTKASTSDPESSAIIRRCGTPPGKRAGDEKS